MTMFDHTIDLKNQGGEILLQIDVEMEVVWNGSDDIELQGLTSGGSIITGPGNDGQTDAERLLWELAQRDLDTDLDVQACALDAVQSEAA